MRGFLTGKTARDGFEGSENPYVSSKAQKSASCALFSATLHNPHHLKPSQNLTPKDVLAFKPFQKQPRC
jgi:hypothetical protein